MSKDEQLQRFCEMFEAYPTESDRKFYKRTKIDSWSSYNDPSIHYHAEVVKAVAIHIPEHRIEDFLDVVVDEKRYLEMEIRNNVPAVKKAYEHYQLLLKMCGADYAGY